MKRFIFDVVLVLSLFIFPWWVVLSLGVVGAFWKQHFYELAFVGLIIDLLYAPPGESLFGIPYLLTWVALSLFFIIDYFARERLRIYT